MTTNKVDWNRFVVGIDHSVFQQSWEWGEFQQAAGFPIFRVGVEDKGILVAAATIIKKPLLLGRSYLYCPNGPLIGKRNQEKGKGIKNAVELMFEQIRVVAAKEKVVFSRFEPDEDLYNRLADHRSTIIKTIDVQPPKTIIIDLAGTAEEILGQMHQKTRYNIRLSSKKNLRIFEAGSERFEEFWKLMDETRERDGFRLHDKGYYRKMLDTCAIQDFSEELSIKLVCAEVGGKIAAANIVAIFGDTATYVHGSSSSGDRNLMAPYAVQWHSMMLAKQAGCQYYDLYGVDEAKWPGVTRFKRGFGGMEIEKPGTFDLAYNEHMYRAYKAMRKLRRMM